MKKNQDQNEAADLSKAEAGPAAADLLTDSLLKGYTANPEGEDDEDFLNQVEAAMDAGSEGRSEFVTTEVREIPKPRTDKGRGRRFAWAAGLAAVLAVSAVVLALTIQRASVRSNPAMMIASVAEDSPADSLVLATPVERRDAVPMAMSAPASNPSDENYLPRQELAKYPSSMRREEVILKDPTATPSERPALPRMYFGQVSDVGRSESLRETGLVTRLKENSTARYGQLVENNWKSPVREPLSTFSIDVDTASWTNIRGMLERGVSLEQIPKDAVRIEEMINYFDWNYPQPDDDHPFGFAVESASCPWQADHRLLRVAIQGKNLKRSKRPPANLVFLLDVSGSMNQPDKLPLVQRAISVLVEELNADDCVSMVVYAGAEGVALHPTKGNQQAEILDALNRLRAGGSTNGGAGIDLAYKMVAQNFIKDGINRVILCTDGDFNVGRTGTESLVQFVERKAKRDRTFLSVCGFGDDNLNDAMLEAITNKGNGTYYYIDSFAEARKVFLKDLMGTLVTIAKDVKIQVEFNPGEVKAYRLIGYSNRRLAAEDFANDKVDAGEIGAGHTVTAFYEIVPAGNPDDPSQDVTSTLRYQRPAEPEPAPDPKFKVVPSHELALLKLRYKKPDGDKSIFLSQPVMPNERDWQQASDDFRFASAVALFGLKLRDHESARDTELADIIALTKNATGKDPHGYRAEFVKLLKQLGR